MNVKQIVLWHIILRLSTKHAKNVITDVKHVMEKLFQNAMHAQQIIICLKLIVILIALQLIFKIILPILVILVLRDANSVQIN
jgi:hypothetical protein